MIHKSYLRNYLLFVLLIASFYGQSQSFKGYAHGGIIASQVDGDGEGGYNKPGIFAGIAVSFPLKNGNDLMLELNYIELGARKNINPDIGDYTKYIFRTNYIQVPVFYRYNVHPRLSLDGGVSFSTLIKSRQFDIHGEVPISGPELHKFDIGAIVGFNFHLNSHWGAMLRWGYSMVPFRQDPTSNFFWFRHHDFHRYINTSVQYRF